MWREENKKKERKNNNTSFLFLHELYSVDPRGPSVDLIFLPLFAGQKARIFVVTKGRYVAASGGSECNAN